LHEKVDIYKRSGAMNINKITDYVNSNEHIGLDRILTLQLKTDGWIASKIGLSSLGSTGFILGFLVCYFMLVA
jgi:hypothetical protein